MDRTPLNSAAEARTGLAGTEGLGAPSRAPLIVRMVYGTSEGQTEKIARFLAERLAGRGHRLEVIDAARDRGAPQPQPFDAIVIAASVHAGRYQPAITEYVRRHLRDIESHPNAFLSVSLSAAGHEASDLEGLKRCVETFSRETRWTPRIVHHAAGALRYSAYSLIKRWALRAIARRRGAPTDTRRDHELTDWADLARFCTVLDQSFTGTRAEGR
jgi:menaquinone-dependent protoporphyrinogen oxidase